MVQHTAILTMEDQQKVV